MNATSKRFYGIITIAVLLCLLGGYKVYRHEQSQNAQLRQLQSLEGRTDYLEQRPQQVTDYYNVQPKYRDDAYNYLAIGNSLTLITSWGRGICATQPDGDYFGIVNANRPSRIKTCFSQISSTSSATKTTSPKKAQSAPWMTAIPLL